MYWNYKVLVLLFIKLTVANSVSETGGGDLPSLDMDDFTRSNNQHGRYVQPGLMSVDTNDIQTGSEQYDIVEAELDPLRHSKHKHPKKMDEVNNHSFNHLQTDTNDSTDDNTDISTTKVNVRTIIWKAESRVLVDRCRQGAGNSAWNETECISCECQSNQISCHKPKCPKLKCNHQIKVDGECCPKCPEKLCETADGRRFKHGAEWHMDDCTFCECEEGKVLCSVEDCQVPRCKNPIKVPGRCCPVCLDASCRSSNGTKIIAEEVWKEGICTHCYCSGGEKKCDEERCPYVNCTARHTPEGKCCEKCNEGVVDCVVSDWGSWSECPIQECGGGMTRRFRNVVVPSQNGGSFCPHMSEAQMCPRLPCDVLPVCPVTAWSSWSHCTATCGNGRKMRTRERAPITKSTMTSLIDCSETHFQETRQCYEGACEGDVMSTDEADALIHDDICYHVTWSEWGACSSECGTGIQKRHQVLLNESHPRGHLCRLLDEVRKCECELTDVERPVVRCKVSPWSSWSSCSKTCGGGTRTKKRKILREPSGGATCPNLSITKQCRTKPCSSKSDSYGKLPLIGDLCFTDDGNVKFHGDVWIEDTCAMCSCDHSQIRCQNTECEG